MPADAESQQMSPSSLTVANVLFDDRFGGPQRRVIEIGRLLISRGVRTIVIMPIGTGSAAGYAEAAGVSVQRIGFSRPSNLRSKAGFLRWLALLPRDVFRFMHLYRSIKPDVVHVNGIFMVAAAIAARLTWRPLVWHLNDTIVPKPIAGILGSLARIMANRLVVAAAAVAKHYDIERDYFVLPAPVSVDRIKPRDATAKDNGLFRVGLIANWNPNKGIEEFVSGCAIAAPVIGDSLRVVFAGSRVENHLAYASRVERLIDETQLRDRVTDHGFVHAIEDILRLLDVVVLSSISEASPMVVLEAMAAGLPVVATDVGGVREIVEDPANGAAAIIIPARDPRALGEALVRLYRDPGLRKSIGALGRERAEAFFSAEECVRRHIAIYSAAMDADGGSATVDRSSPKP